MMAARCLEPHSVPGCLTLLRGGNIGQSPPSVSFISTEVGFYFEVDMKNKTNKELSIMVTADIKKAIKGPQHAIISSSEVVAKNNSPSLVYAPHPLMPGKNRLVRFDIFIEGETIAGYLLRHDIHFGAQPVVLARNDKIIPQNEWGSTKLKGGDLISIHATVKDGSGNSDPKRTVLMIAVVVAAYYTGGALAGTFAQSYSGLATATVLYGGMMLVNSIAPIPMPELSMAGAENDSPTYSLAGGSNRARPFAPLPLVIGAHRVFADLGAKPFTEFHGNDHYLYQMFNFGLSDIRLSSFKIGDTPLSDFADYRLEESDSSGAIQMFPGNVDSLAGGSLPGGTWVTRTSSVDAEALSVDITGALFRAGDSGIEVLSAEFAIEYRKVGDSTWLTADVSDNGIEQISMDSWDGSAAFGYPSLTPVSDINLATERSSGVCVKDLTFGVGFDSTFVWVSGQCRGTFNVTVNATPGNILIRNNTREPVRRSYYWQVAKGQYEVQVRKVSADETDVRNTADFSWATLRTYQADSTSYTGQKRVALKIKASGQLNGTIDRFNAIATGQVPVWDSGTSTWSTAATSNPAWWFLWFARGATDSNGQRIYGAGLPDSRIDIETIKSWGAWCDSKSIECNLVFDRVMTVGAMLGIIARCGRASHTWANGTLGVIYDQANQPAVQVFGMNNIRRNTFSVAYASQQLADEVVLRFINPDIDWQQDTVRATVPGVTSPARPVDVEVMGITDKAQAGKEANLIAATHAYRTRRITWESDFEGMVCSRGDVVTLSHDLTQWGYSGRLVAGTTTVLQLDRKVPFTSGQSHYIGIRFPDGSYNIYDVVYQAGSVDTITLGTALPSAPDSDPDHPPMDYTWVFEPTATPGKKVKIIDIKPLSDRHVRMTAIDEDDNYYLAELNAYTYLPGAVSGVQVPTISNLAVADTLVRAGAGFATSIIATWEVSGEFGGAKIRAGFDGGPLVDVGRTLSRRLEFPGAESGTVTVEVTLFNLAGEYGPISKATLTHTIEGKSALPQDVAGFSATQNGGVVVFKWFQVPDVDVSGYEIRYGSSYDDGTPVTEVTKGTQITTAIIPPGDHTFYIKARDTSGNESANPGSAQLTVISDYDLILQNEQAPAWGGTLTNFVRHWTGVLVPQSQNLASADGWETFDQFVPNPYTQCIYESPEMDIDFDDTVRVWGNIDSALGPGETGLADPKLEIDSRTDAGSYVGFFSWSIGNVLGRYFKHRLVLDTSVGVAKITGFLPTVDIIERTERKDNVTVSASGTAITFDRPFHSPPQVEVTPVGATALIGMPDNITATGFTARTFDTAGTGTAGTVNWSATG